MSPRQRRALAFGQVTSQATILRNIARVVLLTDAERAEADVAVKAMDRLAASIRAGFAPREDS